MTKHKSPEARRAEILDAAARVIDEVGYRNLTMERIIAHTSLSKGGVYRFFRNKREVALALFGQVMSHWTELDQQAVLGWGLPLRDTLLRLLVHNGGADQARARRIWLQLLPACLDDPEFLAAQNAQTAIGQRRYRDLIRALLARDGPIDDGRLEQVLERAIRVGTLFMQGMLLSSFGADQGAELEQLLFEFIEGMVANELLATEPAAVTLPA